MREISINTWSEFVEYVDEYIRPPRELERMRIFRGASNAAWTLQPSLRRYFPKGAERKVVRNAEARALKEFHVPVFPHQQPYFQQQKRSRIDYWVLMQHYRAPTRLLDWTKSPFVACYFAVEQHQDMQQIQSDLVHKTNANGAVWVLNHLRMEYFNTNEMKRLKFQAEDGVKSYSNVAALVDDASEDFLRSDNLFDAIESFLHHHYTDRMVAQQAVFTIALDVLADHLELIQNLEARSGEEFLLKLIIPAGLKEEFLHRLVAMNITAAALFPGIDGAGKAVAEYVALRAWEAEQSKP